MSHWTETDEWNRHDDNWGAFRVPGGTIVGHELGGVCFVPDLPSEPLDPGLTPTELAASEGTDPPEGMDRTRSAWKHETPVKWEDVDWSDPPDIVRAPVGFPGTADTAEYLVYDPECRAISGENWDYYSEGRFSSTTYAVKAIKRGGGDAVYVPWAGSDNLWTLAWKREPHVTLCPAWETVDWKDPLLFVRAPSDLPDTAEYLLHQQSHADSSAWGFYVGGQYPTLQEAADAVHRMGIHDVMYARTRADRNVWERVWRRGKG